MNSTRSGSHHFATRSARKPRSAVGVERRRRRLSTTHAHGRSPHARRHRDHRRLEHLGVGHDLVLELDRRDPLAAGLDEVLGAVDQPDVRAVAQLGDVAGAQPAVLGELLVATCRRRSSARAIHGPRTCSSPPASSSMRNSTSGTTRPCARAERVGLVLGRRRRRRARARRRRAGWSRSCPRPGRSARRSARRRRGSAPRARPSRRT